MACGARAQAPDPQAQGQHQDRHRHEPEEIGQRKPALQQRMRELTRKALLALIAVIAVVSVWTPLGWRYVG
jgi:cell division protein FtsL